GGTYGTLPTPTKTGYAFDGWYKETTFATPVTSATTVTTAAHHSLYAKWTAVATYALTVNAGANGNSPTGGGSYTNAHVATIAATAAAGYSFQNWTRTSGTLGAFGNANANPTTYTMGAGAVTVQASFTANVYTVTYEYDGATGGNATPSKPVTFGGTYGTLPTPTKTGYAFDGWYKETTFATPVTSATTVTTAANHPLYAKWTAATTYALTVNAGAGGSSPTGGGSFTNAHVATIAATAGTGYSFQNWTRTAGSLGSFGNANANPTTYTMGAGAVTVQANFTANVYTVTFNAQGGTVSPASKAVTFNGTYGTLPTPTREGYAFLGWHTAASGGTRVTASTQVTQASNHALWAYWEEGAGAYLSDAEGGEGGAPTVTTAYTGFLYDGDNTVQGTLTLNAKMASKLDKKTGITTTNWTVSAKAIMQGATVSFSGKPTGELDRFTAFTKNDAEKIDVTMEGDRFHGTVSGTKVGGTLTVDGARNAFADKKDVAAKARLNDFRGLYNVALLDATGGQTSPFAEAGGQTSPFAEANEDVRPPQGYVSLNVGNLGAVKFAGLLSDGTKVSGSGRLLDFLNDDGWLCVALYKPLYSKKGFIGGLLWIDADTGAVRVDADNGWLVGWACGDPKKGTFARELDVVGGYFGTGKTAVAPPTGLAFGADCGRFGAANGDVTANEDVRPPEGMQWVEEAFPWALPVAVNGLKLSIAKGVAPAKPPKGETAYGYGAFNNALATLSYTAKTGVFKGKFTLYYDGDAKGKPQHKAVGVSYSGLVLPNGDGKRIGLGIGITTLNKQKVGVPVFLH
ncbi:MAG: InlB B-repeat-containing protein, partial [Kiritimatiellaeota bacterium]|nr:InlB B-repeat-containing protein [Kiritimatiellota bacterium]